LISLGNQKECLELPESAPLSHKNSENPATNMLKQWFGTSVFKHALPSHSTPFEHKRNFSSLEKVLNMSVFLSVGGTSQRNES
jgi:hypothetical protein